MSSIIRIAAFIWTLLSSAAASAGAPYVTDDPEPTDPGKWEVLFYTAGERSAGLTEAEAGFDINYGLAENLQIAVDLPVGYSSGSEQRIERGDIEVALKYKFVHEDEHGIVPDISIYPAIGTPTGSSAFSSGTFTLFLPLWAQKNIGKWHLFGGGGWGLNPGDGNRDYWLTGVGVTRDVSDKLSIGGELYHQTADEVGGFGFTRVGIGAQYQIRPKWAMLASVGRGLEHPRETGRTTFYIGLQFAN
jgi:hypothetical protein